MSVLNPAHLFWLGWRVGRCQEPVLSLAIKLWVKPKGKAGFGPQEKLTDWKIEMASVGNPWVYTTCCSSSFAVFIAEGSLCRGTYLHSLENELTQTIMTMFPWEAGRPTQSPLRCGSRVMREWAIDGNGSADVGIVPCSGHKSERLPQKLAHPSLCPATRNTRVLTAPRCAEHGDVLPQDNTWRWVVKGM